MFGTDRPVISASHQPDRLSAAQGSGHLGQRCPNLPFLTGLSSGKTSEELRGLDYWQRRTGQTLANYGPNFDFWCCLLPLCAWQSQAIFHLVVACTLVDEQLGL
jgi:hypothetical protein